MKHFKKWFVPTALLFFAFLFALSSLAAEGGAISREARSWYVKRNKEHKQPVFDTEQKNAGKYSVYYVDTAHGYDSSERVIYLTFDAGYENGNIERILDILKEELVMGMNRVPIDKNMTKTELRIASEMSTTTLAKLSKNETVSMDTILRICEVLNCNMGDIIDVENKNSGK